MREPPSGAALLDTARELLRNEVLAALPADKKHAALMIANAMSIAGRQLSNGERPNLDELASLVTLVGPNADTGSTEEQLLALNRRLGRLIRAGGADSGQPASATWKHLMMTARQRVAESNPKYLSGRP